MSGALTIGEVGEALIVAQLLSLGFYVCYAHSGGSPWDLIADWRGKVSRIQVKTTTKPIAKGSGIYRVHATRQHSAHYTQQVLDYFVFHTPIGNYIIPLDKVTDDRPRLWLAGTHRSKEKLCKYETFRGNWDLLK